MLAFAWVLVLLTVSVPVFGTDTVVRESVTFILGEDQDPALPMYRLAESHFRADSQERTDQVVNSAHSFAELRQYLFEHPPKNGQPWGLVNLVIHGDARGQMDVPLRRGGSPASIESLSSAALDGVMTPLPDALLDASSEIRLHGCALGQDLELLQVISRAFGGGDPQRPKVRASRLFTCYQRGIPDGTVSRFLCEGWSLAFPPGKPPSRDEVARRLRKQCPDLDVRDALTRVAPRAPGDTFMTEGPQSFRWTKVLGWADEIPVLKSRARLMVWLRSQGGFLSGLKKCGLEMDECEWEATQIRYVQDGDDHPAIRVQGMSWKLHILRSVGAAAMAFEDERYWACAR